MIRCPESWARLAPRDELEAILELLDEEQVRVLVRIAARIHLRRRPDDLLERVRVGMAGRGEIQEGLVYLACRWLVCS